MKVTLNWLKKYVDFNWTAEELAERLTMLGLEVEAVTKIAGEFEGIVIAQVITREKHPNADKLSVCRVFDGKTERQIVCGADNFKPGDKVPLILPGYSLPKKPDQPPVQIKVGKIRGVESYGMMCSPGELGLSGDNTGLLILPEDAPVGKPFGEYLGRAESDVVYDLEITPNRPDLNSVIGIAREISAVTGNPLRIPQIGELATDATKPAEQFVAVRLDAPELCPRYVARVVLGVKIGESPQWLKSLLEKVGLRPINNVVDVTNFVMLETGQPLHAFDYNLIAREDGKPTIIVRCAQDGEKFVTLDGKEHTLTARMLLIADPQKAVALAGVMGGLNSEINDNTTDVLIESAYFNPTNIRRTSKALGLRTDASYRFERGVDIAGCDYASLRCAQLILETAGGVLCNGVVDACAQPITQKKITLRHHKVNELLGLELQPAEIEYYLCALGLKLVDRKPRPFGVELPPEPATFLIPTFRVDLKRETDLIEEVARLHGVEKIPATPPRGAIGFNEFDAIFDQISEVRRILTGLGLDEAQGQTLISEEAAKLAEQKDIVLLANPLSSDMNALRPSLLPGILDSLRHNISHKNYNVALFEIGAVFRKENNTVKEQRRVAIAITGNRHELFWEGAGREDKYDIFDLKGIVEEFLENFGIRGVVYLKRDASTPIFYESAVISLGGKLQLGELGQLQPQLNRKYDLRDPVLLAELDLDMLIARRNPTRVYKSLPQFPAIRRDVAMIIPESVTHDAVLQAVKKAKPQFLESVELFDVFRGKNIPQNYKSVAYTFTYRSPEKTLTDQEVNQIHEKLVEQLKLALNAQVREA